VREFLTEHKALIGVKDMDAELEQLQTNKDKMGNTHIRLKQSYKGIPVCHTQLVIHLDAENRVIGTNGEFHPNIKLEIKPTVSAVKAVDAAKRHAKKAEEIKGQTPTREIFIAAGKPTLCWHVRLDGEDGKDPALWEYFIDAGTGKVVFRYNSLMFHTGTTGWGRGRYAGCKVLNTYHNHSEGTYQLRDTTRSSAEVLTYDLAGSSNRDNITLSADPNNAWNDRNRTPRENSQEPEVDAHYYLGIVLDYYANVHGRDSYDDLGSNAEICVHYRNNWDNALWDLHRNRIYLGDDTGVNRDYWSSLDIIAHEFTHGVTANSAGLNYWDPEGGGLHESFSDFFAAMINQDWLFGEEICLTAGAPNDALRSQHDPTLYGDPDHYNNIGAGVHANSCITSKAGYLMTHGGTNNGIEIYALGKEVTQRLWYRALVTYLTPTSQYTDFRAALEDSCGDLYPGSPWILAVVQNALASVGIGNAVDYPMCPGLSIPECYFRQETWPCLMRSETGQIVCESFRAETGRCLIRNEIGPGPGEGGGPCCSRELILEPRPGPCEGRELIIEPSPGCSWGDTLPVFTPEGCPRENPLVIGRLTKRGTIEPIEVRPMGEGESLKHVRILTNKRSDRGPSIG
jgi:thermolysin